MTSLSQMLVLGFLCTGSLGSAGCDQISGSEEAAPELGAARTDSIELVVLRMDQQTGEALVSSGIPLKPGVMQTGTTKNVRLVINGEEQAVFVRELPGRHRDGSVRSILVQFRYPLDPTSRVKAALVIGSSVTRTKPDLAGVTPAYTYRTPVAQAVALPSAPAYLMATELVGPTTPPEPAFNLQYEKNFTEQSDVRWAWFKGVYGGALTMDQAIGANYYDRSMFHWAWWVRTGNPEYWKRANHYLMAFRELYLKPANYNTQPHNWQMEGLSLHYRLTGDEESRKGIQLHATAAREIWLKEIGLAQGEYNEGRIQERVVQALLAAVQVGLVDQDYPALLRTSLGKIVGTQQPNGSYGFKTWCGGTSNFMVGLVNDILIRYYETFEQDPRILSAVRQSADWLWNTQWKMADGAFRYESINCHNDGPETAPDLNMLMLNAFGWVYARTGDAVYRQRGDVIFKEAVTRAWLGSNAQQADKQYNQQYRSSFRYPFYRR